MSKPVQFVYFSEDGSVSLSDLKNLLSFLGYELDSWGRDSKAGEIGRFVCIIPKEETK